MNKYARELTPEEKAKPYSKYFHNAPTPPPAEWLAAMNEPVDSAKATPVRRLNDLLNPGYLEVERGWCQMPDGTGFIANLIPMPGVTAEMFDWWFTWFALEDLRYMLWYPPGHFAVTQNDRDRARALNPNLPMNERRLRLEYVIEDVGGPSTDLIEIDFMSPEEFGFDMSRFHPPNAATAVCGNPGGIMLDPPPGIPNQKTAGVMVHLIREVPGGVEMRSRFWLGWHILNRKSVRCIPDGIRIPEFIIRGMALHNVHEFTNLASFLPQLYAEQKGLVA